MSRELLLRLGAAFGEDWELNADIARCLGWTRNPEKSNQGVHVQVIWREPSGKGRNHLPNFTGSVDAALELLPYGMIWLATPRLAAIAWSEEAMSRANRHCGATAPIALCAAILADADVGRDT